MFRVSSSSVVATSLAVCLCVAQLIAPASAQAEPGSFHLSAYSGRAAEDRLLEIMSRFQTGFIDSYLVALAPAYVVARGRNIRWEAEAQAVRHWGDQDHWEFNGLYIARWMNFPWDHRIDTRFAVGGGLSWATEVPVIEPRAGRTDAGESSRILAYLLVELEFAPPRESDWSGFIRLHHRSGASGLISDVRGGSNFITLGARYHF